jgi:hypothetical protein
MERQATTTQDKQVTVEVPAERVPEFYAMYARFLAGRRRGARGRGRPGRHGGGCGRGGHRAEERAGDPPVTEA